MENLNTDLVKLFIQLEIGDWKESPYHKPWRHYATSLSSDMMGTDLDNQSDAVVVDLVLKLIDQADKVFLLIAAHDATISPGAAQKVILYSMKHVDRIEKVVLTGEHPQVESLLATNSEKVVKESREIQIKDLLLRFSQ